jgi:hypothetical protein
MSEYVGFKCQTLTATGSGRTSCHGPDFVHARGETGGKRHADRGGRSVPSLIRECADALLHELDDFAVGH